MLVVHEIVTEEIRGKLRQAEQLRPSRRLLALRRARRRQDKAERRMVEARRRAARLRGALESVD